MRKTHAPRPSLLLMALLAALVALPGLPALAQSGDDEPDDNTKAMNYSLYYEEYKNRNYEGALPYLRWMLENAPTFPNGTDKNFERAVVLYDSLAARQSDEALARAYLDTAVTMYDRAMEVLGASGSDKYNEFEWTLNKGRFLQSRSEQLPDMQDDVYVLYRQAYDLNADELPPYYINIIIGDLARKDKVEAVEFMDEVEAKFPDVQETNDYIAQIRGFLFRTPEERMGFLEDRLAKDPGNLEYMTELFEIYQELGERDKMYAMGEQLMEMDPTPAIYRMIGQLRLNDGQPREAFEMFEKALDMPGATASKELYYNMGLAQQEMGSLSRARTYFRRALEVDSDYGPAIIAIADLYVTAVAECGTFEREDKAVYWLVLDYLERAKARDASVANAANTKIRTYRQYLPNAEDKFFMNWEAGQSYQVSGGCYDWIGESTRVR